MIEKPPQENPPEENPIEENNPIESLMDQIAGMYSFIEKNKLKEVNMTPELQQQLDGLGQAVKSFVQLNEDMLKDAGANFAELEKLVETLPATLTPKLGKTLKFSKTLKSQIDQMRREMTIAALEQDKYSFLDRSKESKEVRKEDIQKRKKKFKNMGGDKKWLKM